MTGLKRLHLDKQQHNAAHWCISINNLISYVIMYQSQETVHFSAEWVVLLLILCCYYFFRSFTLVQFWMQYFYSLVMEYFYINVLALLCKYGSVHFFLHSSKPDMGQLSAALPLTHRSLCAPTSFWSSLPADTHTSMEAHTQTHANYPPSNSNFILIPRKTSAIFLMFHLHAQKKAEKTSKMNTSTISNHSISARQFLSHAL